MSEALLNFMFSDITLIDLNWPYWKFYTKETDKVDYFKNIFLWPI